MEELRWILLVFGVLLIAGIYYLDRFKRRPAEQRAAEHRSGDDVGNDFSMAPKPPDESDNYQDAIADLSSLLSESRRSAEADIDTDRLQSTDEDQAEPADAESVTDDATETAETRVNTDNATPQPATEAGPDRTSAQGERLVVLYLKAPPEHVFTGPALFEALEAAGLSLGSMGIYHDRDDRNEPLFSVANLFEPGTLDVDDAEQFSTRGLAMFMQLPGPADEIRAFDRMLAKSEFIAERIGGELHDDRHEPLDRMAVERIRSTFLVP